MNSQHFSATAYEKYSHLEGGFLPSNLRFEYKLMSISGAGTFMRVTRGEPKGHHSAPLTGPGGIVHLYFVGPQNNAHTAYMQSTRPTSPLCSCLSCHPPHRRRRVLGSLPFFFSDSDSREAHGASSAPLLPRRSALHSAARSPRLITQSSVQGESLPAYSDASGSHKN